MSTRGLYGLRKKGVDKMTYSHGDSYPDRLGMDIIKFCKNNSIQDLNRLYELIELIDKNKMPTDKQKEICKKNGYTDFSVGSGNDNDWYCLLRNLQSNFDVWQKAIDNNQYIMMNDNSEFIKNSLYCEYAYIINLDENVLEFYVGFQEKPDVNNRYGYEIFDNDAYFKYYPCKCVSKLSLDCINRNTTESIIKYLKEIAGNDNYDEEIEYKKYEEYESLLNNLDEVEWEKDEDRGNHHFYWFMITGEWNKFLTKEFSQHSTMSSVIIGTYDAVEEVLICDGIGMFKDYHTEEIRDERIIKLLKLKIKGYEMEE